ncbi:MAG: metallophosphoesterase [Isosphaeraceae bacterium]
MAVKSWPVELEYPIVAITDVHGQLGFLDRLLSRLKHLEDWQRHSIVFVGDYVDRGPDVRGTIDRVLELAGSHPSPVAAVMGNHDLALVRAAQLDDGPPNRYWTERYYDMYDHESTFSAYLGRVPHFGAWEADLAALGEAMPESHRRFLSGLPWLVEAAGHLFLHNGLSPELIESAEEQLDALRARRWDASLHPRPGTRTETYWQLEYPVWLGADKRLADAPLAVPGRLQVTGHKPVPIPDVDDVRIRFDTSGGLHEPLTACILSGPADPPRFVRSNARER